MTPWGCKKSFGQKNFGPGISPTIYRAQNPETHEKSPKSLPRGVWDPPTPDPQKVPKKVRKVKKIVKLDFSDFFWNLLRVRRRAFPQSLSGDFLETFRSFRVSGSVDGGRDPKSSVFFPVQGRGEEGGFQGRWGWTSWF